MKNLVIVARGRAAFCDVFRQYQLVAFQLSNLAFIGADDGRAVGVHDAIKKLVNLLFHGGHFQLERPAALFRLLGTTVPQIAEHGGRKLDELAHRERCQLGVTYNPASQVVSRTLSNDSYAYPYHNRSQAYVANGLNQYASVAGAAYGYDSSGNLTGDPGTATNSAGAVTLGYDAENRLILASGARSAALTYDPLGRLFQVAGAATSTFLYDGDALVEEYSAAGVLQQRTVHGAGDDDPLLFYTGSAVTTGALRSYQADAQGSIVSVADGSGTGQSTSAYDDWGRLLASTPPRFGYTGLLWLGDVGLYHYKARVYSPAIGRFLQTDPTGYDDQVNLYAYVGNDPGNGSDPTGKERCQGPDADCAQVSAGAQRVRDMAAKTPEGSELRATAVAMGAPGKGSLIITDSKAITPTFDSAKGGIVVGPSITRASNPDLAGQTITHEVVHEMDQKAGGDIKTGKELIQREEHAYGVANEYRSVMGWKPIDVKGFAKSSFKAACKGSNSKHASCQ